MPRLQNKAILPKLFDIKARLFLPRTAQFRFPLPLGANLTPMLTRLLFLPSLITIGALASASVEFPGPQPGKAQAEHKKNFFSLSNHAITASWSWSHAHLKPQSLLNRLESKAFNERSTQLFRLATKPASTHTGAYVGIRIEANRVVALASADGDAWTELSSYPISDFPGAPSLIRIGKMSLKGEPTNNPGDIGPTGQSTVAHLSFAPKESLQVTAHAHEGFAKEYPFPKGSKFVSCWIDKQTDQGMTWGPALEVVFPQTKKFLLVGLRDKNKVFNVITDKGERILDQVLNDSPMLDLTSDSFTCLTEPKITKLKPNPNGIRAADRVGGMAIEADLMSAAGIRARWRAELRDGSNYIRQTVAFSSPRKEISIHGVEFADVKVPDAKTIGTVPGCPVAGSGMFVGVEMPGAISQTDDAGCRIAFGCKLVLSPKQSYSFGSVVGVAPEGQLRRSFLYYIERERARPSSPFLHYNCWYDLGFSVDAEKMLDAATQFNRELAQKRGVKVQSYLVDDGWDDPSKGLWVENEEKFPGGFKALRPKMAAINANLAIWISPLGGYGGAEERTADAEKLGIIPKGASLDLAYPGYKQWFQDRCLKLMREDGVNAFKWDRAGDGVSPHFMALLDIAKNLRQENKSVFINVTVGTWPSPFWLNHVDSTWRNGSADVGWAGKGDMREKWMTFRDGYCKRMFVDRSPLYPLNSVMHHGLVHGRNFQGEPIGKTGPHLRNEARSYFGNGTSLQELYLTPSMMDQAAWDDVADAANWAQANADVLVDSHWVGGDPLQLQVYGYASWNPHKVTLMLRNPNDKPQSIILDPRVVFELPPNAPTSYTLKSPYPDQRIQTIRECSTKKPLTIELKPFEVLVFDGGSVG